VNELALFAGAGGGILGGKLLGWRTICAVELDPYCRRVLLARQRDGFLPRFPIWDNVTTFDCKPWSGRVDVISGGFPCTDISIAGRGAGLRGQASSLWHEMARIISEIMPRYVFVENSAMLTIRGLDRVAADLASLGYDARWGVISAAHVGARHKRERIWIVATLADTNNQPAESGGECRWERREEMGQAKRNSCRVFNDPSEFLRESNGLANKLDRLRAIGNGQVPAVVRLAWHLLGGAA
jgi:DNA (cytosine-5)-methyltransferase 1